MNWFIRLNPVEFFYDMYRTLTNPLAVTQGEYLLYVQEVVTHVSYSKWLYKNKMDP